MLVELECKMRQRHESLVMIKFTLGKLHTVYANIDTFFELCLELFQDKISKFSVGLFEDEIVNDDVEIAWM